MMNFNLPKNTEKYEWTQHSIYKMQSYGLTAQRVLRVINNPERKEEGIVKNTVAVMQPTSSSTKNGKKTWKSEVWAMYQLYKGKNGRKSADKLAKLMPKKLRIISAWRYPGVSPEKNPIPEEILRELEESIS